MLTDYQLLLLPKLGDLIFISIRMVFGILSGWYLGDQTLS